MAKDKPKDGLYYGIIPHRPPSDAAVKAATDKYVQQEKDGKLKGLPISNSYSHF